MTRSDRRFTPSNYRFHALKKSYRAYHKKTGKRVSAYTKKGTLRKNVRRITTQTLFVVDKRTGEIKKYGSVNEKDLQKVTTVESSGRNVMIRSTLEKKGIWRKIAKSGTNGVRVRIRGKGKKDKNRQAVVDVILDKEKLSDQDYVMRTVLAKVLNRLGQEKIRVSDEMISKHKKFQQLDGVKIDIQTFGSLAATGDDEDGEDQEDGEWAEGSEDSTLERKKKRKSKGKPKRKRRRKRSR